MCRPGGVRPRDQVPATVNSMSHMYPCQSATMYTLIFLAACYLGLAVAFLPHTTPRGSHISLQASTATKEGTETVLGENAPSKPSVAGGPSPFDVYRMQQIAKDYIETGSGFTSPVKPDLMSDEFVFRGACPCGPCLWTVVTECPACSLTPYRHPCKSLL